MTQVADTVADHVQSRVVFTVSAPVPPFSGNVVVGVLTCTWHFWRLGAAGLDALWVDVQPMMLPQTPIVMLISVTNDCRTMAVRLAFHAQNLPHDAAEVRVAQLRVGVCFFSPLVHVRMSGVLTRDEFC